VLVEKLLRSTSVKKIYLLIRPKKGLQTSVRLEELMSAKLYDNLKKVCLDVMARVEAVNGDITEPSFGISEDDER
jgi:fatty acyl-CoA reductase